MSLLSIAYEPCVVMDKTTEADGYGGIKTTWTEGAEFEAAIVPSGGVQQLVAQQRGWSGSYEVTTPRSVLLYPGDVFKAETDGRIFRVKDDSTRKKTPSTSALDARQAFAEDYRI